VIASCWPTPRGRHPPHLFIVISDPSQNTECILLVGVTTWEEYKDDSCILEPADWPDLDFLKHRSCIDYRHAIAASEAEVEAWIKTKRARVREPASPRLLERVRQGAKETTYLAMKYQLLLNDQGLIEL